MQYRFPFRDIQVGGRSHCLPRDDDLCVDQQARGQHIGESLFEYVKQQAKEQGCYEVTLNVWAGNTSAEHFYEKMGMKTKERQMEYIL